MLQLYTRPHQPLDADYLVEDFTLAAKFEDKNSFSDVKLTHGMYSETREINFEQFLATICTVSGNDYPTVMWVEVEDEEEE